MRTHITERQQHRTDPPLADARRVLVVEDDPALRDLMANVLAAEGYFVTETADSPAMLRAVKAAESSESPFDLIVTDVRMPGQSGLEALAHLREVGCQTPTIVVTAFPDEKVQRQALELDTLLLPKPFALETLRSIANRILATDPQDV